MDEREMLKKLQEEAENVEIPEELKPENVQKMLEASGGRNKRWNMIRCAKWTAAAAAIAVVFGTAFTAGIIKNKSAQNIGLQDAASADESTRDTTVDFVSDADTIREEAGSKTELGDMYTLAADYGDVYDALYQAERLEEESRKESVTAGSGMVVEDAVAESGALNGSDSSDGVIWDMEQSKADDYSKTNLMTAGVDESDIVKTDGKYLYVAESRKVSVYDIQGETPKRVNELTPLKNASDRILELYVDGDTMILVVQEASASLEDEDVETAGDDVLSIADVYYMDGEVNTAVYVFDISDRKKPQQKEGMKQDGSYHTSRKVGSYLYLFTDYRMEMPQGEKEEALTGDALSSWIPSVNERAVMADCIYLPKEGQNSLLIAAVDVTNPGEVIDTKMIVNSYADVYVSNSSIFLYQTNYEENQCLTRIAKFSMDDGKITAVDAAAVNGCIEDCFAINEYQGHLRVLVTDYSGDEEENAVYVLDDKMKLVGEISGLARGETIYSARFMKNIGYFVTYRNTDPLFTVDFSEPTDPKIIGELKVTGFSEYLHFWGGNMLLGIGYETDPESGERKGMKISMFDISKPDAVTEKDRLVLEGVDYSPAVYNYKAVLADDNKNLIGFYTEQYGEKKSTASYDVFSYQEGEGFVRKMSEQMEYDDGAEDCRGLYAGSKFYIVKGGKILTFDMENDFIKVE